MNETVLCALIGFIGSLIGAAASIAAQMLINNASRKNLIDQTFLLKRVEVYQKAIKYIIELCQISLLRKNDSDGWIEKEKDNDDFYRSFYYEFKFYITESVEEKYNEIRKQAENGSINTAEAYKKITKLLKLKVPE